MITQGVDFMYTNILDLPFLRSKYITSQFKNVTYTLQEYDKILRYMYFLLKHVGTNRTVHILIW